MSPSIVPSRSRRPLGARLGASSIVAWSARRWLVADVATVAAAPLMGIPTGIVQTSLYTRMTPVTWWDYPVWALSAVLIGLTAATYVRSANPPTSAPDRSRRTVGATLLTVFAVGALSATSSWWR